MPSLASKSAQAVVNAAHSTQAVVDAAAHDVAHWTEGLAPVHGAAHCVNVVAHTTAHHAKSLAKTVTQSVGDGATAVLAPCVIDAMKTLVIKYPKTAALVLFEMLLAVPAKGVKLLDMMLSSPRLRPALVRIMRANRVLAVRMLNGILFIAEPGIKYENLRSQFVPRREWVQTRSLAFLAGTQLATR
jgi:hypothetical protein